MKQIARGELYSVELTLIKEARLRFNTQIEENKKYSVLDYLLIDFLILLKFCSYTYIVLF